MGVIYLLPYKWTGLGWGGEAACQDTVQGQSLSVGTLGQGKQLAKQTAKAWEEKKGEGDGRGKKGCRDGEPCLWGVGNKQRSDFPFEATSQQVLV